MKFSRAVSAIILILFIISGTGCEENLNDFDLFTGNNAPVYFTKAPESIKKDESASLCFYCGKPVEGIKDHFLRPLAVVISNSPQSRPQSGLQDACLVYEFPVKGEITNLLAFYNHPFTGDIGPIWSGSDFLLNLAEGKGAVLCHAGHSNQAQDTDTTKITSLNLISHPDYSWRIRNRKAPYNLYSSTEKLLEGNKTLSLYQTNKLLGLFKFQTESKNTQPNLNRIDIIFNPNYKVTYLYNEITSDFVRLVNDKEHTDVNTNTAIIVKNLIIMSTNITDIEALDSIGDQLKGNGDGLLVNCGNIYRIRWDKKINTPTKFYWNNGREITLNPGNTWIHITSPQNKVIVN
ncbi:MAG: hypothetical protein CVU88_00360 [Firmicutes bacterium HGW-Firmicutes-13]|nr:MAG: hypothetical protein CVU88_00360 [Firmicutes bacterium HGW-Firmicutes-13]